MKKQYVPAEVEIVVLETADVLSVSDPTFDPDNGNHNQGGWT